MTVPLLFGWQNLLIVLLLVVVVTVGALVLLAAGKGDNTRADWQAWLDGRSARRRDE